MPKFRKKPVIIEANVFQWGMEAGVMRYNERIPKDGYEYPIEMRSNIHDGYLRKYDEELNDKGFQDGQWKPYIITIHGQDTLVAEGDWILPEPDGIHFYPVKDEVFQNTFELAE